MKRYLSGTDALLVGISVLMTIGGALLYGGTPHYGTIWNLACGTGLFFLFLKFRERELRKYASLSNLLFSLFFSLSFYLTCRQRIRPLLTWMALLLLFAAGLFLVPALRNALAALPDLLKRCVFLRDHPLSAAGIVFVYTLFSIGLFWLRFLPYGSSPDVVNQLQQIHGEIAYCDVHAIGHTLFLKMILSVSDDLRLVIFLQLLMIAFLYALFSHYFVRKGIPVSAILFLVSLVTISCEVLKPYVTPWKDVPYLFCLGILTWLLLRWRENREDTVWEAILLGAALAGTILFRLNGIVIVLFLAGWLLVRAIREKKLRTAFLAAVSFGMVYGGVTFYAYQVLRTESPDNGFSMQVFGTAIAAAVKDGKMTEEERAAVAELLPIEWMEEQYQDWKLEELVWKSDGSPEIENDPDHEVFNNRFILAMGAHKKEVIALYLRLLPRHFPAYLKNILQGTRIVWGHEGFSKAVLFLDPAALLWLLLLMAAAGFSKKTIAEIPWIVGTPVLFNTLSIAISTVTNEDRYLLPTVALFPVLVCVLLNSYGQKQ